MTGPGIRSCRGSSADDEVVTSGSFLVDAETRLNPAAGSIYFGGSGGSKSGSSTTTNVRPSTPEDEDAKLAAVLAALAGSRPPTGRSAKAIARFCRRTSSDRWVSRSKLMIDGQPVFLCCSGCKEKALAEPAETLAKVEKLKQKKPAPASESDAMKSHAELQKPAADDKEAKIAANLARLSDGRSQDRPRAAVLRGAEHQPAGLDGAADQSHDRRQPVFVCCEGCRKSALEDPQGHLGRGRANSRQANASDNGTPTAASGRGRVA